MTRLPLAATATAPRCSRMVVTQALRAWGLAAMADTSALIVSELVTNAVRATGVTERDAEYSALERVALIGLQVRLSGPHLVLEVWDGSHDAPTERRPDANAEDGRGLLLVRTMSASCGVRWPEAGGKVVFAMLALEAVPTGAAHPSSPLRANGRGSGRLDRALDEVLAAGSS
ncbi:ATP-binding protein [Streptomyces sp. 5K101]|uniref:ATP-binding protein n=1 Tax=Streptomyces sp. 5K101 TaxID=3390037 RepID=UPI0039760763